MPIKGVVGTPDQVTETVLRTTEAEFALHRQRGHGLRAFFAARRLGRLRGNVLDDDGHAAYVRELIAAYSMDGPPQGLRERLVGNDRRSGGDRRQRNEGHFPERRSGVDRRAAVTPPNGEMTP
jgi:hypothetical protein